LFFPWLKCLVRHHGCQFPWVFVAVLYRPRRRFLQFCIGRDAFFCMAQTKHRNSSRQWLPSVARLEARKNLGAANRMNVVFSFAHFCPHARLFTHSLLFQQRTIWYWSKTQIALGKLITDTTDDKSMRIYKWKLIREVCAVANCDGGAHSSSKKCHCSPIHHHISSLFTALPERVA
jgi:hypothetical protein